MNKNKNISPYRHIGRVIVASALVAAAFGTGVILQRSFTPDSTTDTPPLTFNKKSSDTQPAPKPDVEIAPTDSSTLPTPTEDNPLPDETRNSTSSSDMYDLTVGTQFAGTEILIDRIRTPQPAKIVILDTAQKPLGVQTITPGTKLNLLMAATNPLAGGQKYSAVLFVDANNNNTLDPNEAKKTVTFLAKK